MLQFRGSQRRADSRLGGASEKVGFVVFLILVVAGVSLGDNFVEKNKVLGHLNEVMTLSNAHTFANKDQFHATLLRDVEGIVGANAEVDVFLYAFEPAVRVSDIADIGTVPNLPGIKRSGDYLQVSTFVAKIWWTQKLFWYQPRDVSVTKFVIVPQDKLGPAYPSPPKDEPYVQDPSLIIDASR